MNFSKVTVEELLNMVDSAAPTPGGGSVSALVIAQGISLLRMVAHLTFNKKKFLGLAEDVKANYLKKFESLADLKIKAQDLITRDTQAYNQVMAAYQLPKTTEDEIKVRKERIAQATILATQVPLETALLGLLAIETAEPMGPYANKNALSDLGVGFLLIEAGIKGAILNVKTNLVGFSHVEFVDEQHKKITEIEDKLELIPRILERIKAELS